MSAASPTAASPRLPAALIARGPLAAVAALTAVAAALRLPTLATQSFWLDEAVTVTLVRRPLGDMLSAIPGSESTPPLYYVLAWLWTRVFGHGEAGLRSLSALIGVATVPLAYAAVARLVTPRAGVVAAALAAVNPLLVWYSQEARAYALLVLLTTIALLMFARAGERFDGRSLAGWALASAAALATHYFALFVVLPEAVWLLVRAPRERRRAVLAAVAAVAAAGVALLPLAVAQASNRAADFIGRSSLVERLVQLPKQYLVGYDAPLEVLATIVALAVAALAFWLLAARASQRERGGARLAATVALPALAVPVVLAIAGVDYLITRNLLAIWLPSVAVLAAGLGAVRAGRVGLVATALLCAISAAVVVGVQASPDYQRSDWRSLAHGLGPAGGLRAVVVSPVSGHIPLSLYLPRTSTFPSDRPVPVQEIDAIAVAERSATGALPPRAAPPPAPSGWRLVDIRLARTYTLIRYRAPRALPLYPASLRALALKGGLSDLVLQAPGR